MPYLTEFITVATINILAVMSPGPAFAMIVRNSLVYSKKTAIFSSIGLGFGVGLHIFYCLFGIGLLISKSIVLFSEEFNKKYNEDIDKINVLNEAINENIEILEKTITEIEKFRKGLLKEMQKRGYKKLF